MFKKLALFFLAAGMVLSTTACRHNNSKNPIANLNSKQPDKVLFDRAMDALKHNKFDVARLTLQTLINTYPDSEYIARAKLSVGDAWYAEGGTAALAQAEAEYKDFITFFPKMPEAAEAQLKVANIHYRQMEKADRDYTHAKRAEDEYRELIQQFADSKLVPEAKQRLLEVQEVLADREFGIGRFYFLRESWAAAIARLKSMTDAYPLYSHADEALFMLGNAYEKEVELLRANKMSENVRAKLVGDFSNKATTAYSKIVSRYPLMPRADDAKERLQAMYQKVPVPTVAAVAQNKAELESRSETGRFGRLMFNFKRGPDMAKAVKVGEPSLEDPAPTNAPEILRNATRMAETAGPNTVTVEQVGKGTPAASESTPHSETPAASGTDMSSPQNPAPVDDKNTLEPASTSSPTATTTPATAPAQVNETQIPEAETNSSASSTSSAANDKSGKKDKNQSSSKKKKKSGLRKLIPF